MCFLIIILNDISTLISIIVRLSEDYMVQQMAIYTIVSASLVPIRLKLENNH